MHVAMSEELDELVYRRHLAATNDLVRQRKLGLGSPVWLLKVVTDCPQDGRIEPAKARGRKGEDLAC